MVPSGYWSKDKIKHIAASWNSKHEEAHVTEILPAEYKPCDINAIVNEQTHLSPDEKNKLRSALLEFSDLFKGECGKYNGDPIDLERNQEVRTTGSTYTSQILPVGSTHLYHSKKE